jgi:hypothetical protein
MDERSNWEVCWGWTRRDGTTTYRTITVSVRSESDALGVAHRRARRYASGFVVGARPATELAP